MTDRISWTSGAPTTQFIMECDRVGQDIGGNFTRLAIYMKAINRGGTGSFDSGYGEQVGTIDNVWAAATHSGSPFLPSGVGGGQQRWRDGPWYVDLGHDSNGYRGGVTLRQRITAPSFSNESTVWFDDFPRIPKVPQAPSNLRLDTPTTPTSFAVRYDRPDDMGAGLEQDHAEWSRADGSVVWDDYGPQGYTSPGGSSTAPKLTPGTLYRVRVRSRNSVGWGPFSGYFTSSTLAGGRAFDGSSFLNASTRAWDGSAWVPAPPRVWGGTAWVNGR